MICPQVLSAAGQKEHSIDGGTEEGSAAVLVFLLTLTSSSQLSALGWRAVVGSDPVSIYILPDTITGC